MINQLTLLSFIIGVILAYQSPDLLQLKEVKWLSLVLVILWQFKPLRKAACSVLCGILLVTVSFVGLQHKQLPQHLWNVAQPLEVQIKRYVQHKQYAHVYEVFVVQYQQTIQLSHYTEQAPLEMGVCYTLHAKLKPRFGSYAWASRVFMRGYIDNKHVVQATHCQTALPFYARWRNQINQSVQTGYSHVQTRPLVQALSVGVKDTLSSRHWDVLKQTGTSHLLAISGLHIGLIYLCIYTLCFSLLRTVGFICLRTNMSVVACVFALFGAGLYVLVTGASITAQRAWFMLALFSFYLIRRQPIASMNVLLLIIVLLLVLDPMSGLGMGLWLSAGAVFILIWQCGQRATVLLLPFYMIPLSAIWVETAWIAPIANLIAIPWVSFVIVPLLMLTGLLILLGVSQLSMLYTFIAFNMQGLWYVLERLSAISPMQTWSLLGPFDALLLTALAVTFLLPADAIKWSTRIVLCLALMFPRAQKLNPDEILLHVLDVGQGQAIVVQAYDKTLLFDTGPRWGDYDAGARQVVPYLKRHRINRIDTLVISHNDIDHRGGLSAVLKSIPVHTVYAGETLPEQLHTLQHACASPQSWSWGATHFEFINLPSDLKGNNASCVLSVRTGDKTILIAGDIEKQAEKQLLHGHTYDKLKADILIAPHHGSRSSSTPAFVTAVAPQIVIYPTGFLNRFKHPHPDVVERYAQIQSKQYSTAQDGGLRVKLSKNNIDFIQCDRQRHKRWWSRQQEAACSGFLQQVGF